VYGWLQCYFSSENNSSFYFYSNILNFSFCSIFILQIILVSIFILFTCFNFSFYSIFILKIISVFILILFLKINYYSYSLYVQLLWYPMYYLGGMKARVNLVQWSKPSEGVICPLYNALTILSFTVENVIMRF
jgi:hypothetical protein